ncbi:glycine-rich domain-containing protein, partial [Algoriphagus aestuariicola]
GTCSSVNSAIITVNVDAPSAVGAVSANQTICSANAPTDLTIASATGTIQWQRADDLTFTANVTNVGTNSTTLTSAQVGALTATRYFRAVVTNGTCSTVNSGVITVTVTPATSINTENLANQRICDGANFAQLSVTASGTGTLSYQWYSNTVSAASGPNLTPVGGDTNAYTPPADEIGTKYYFVIVSSDCGPDVVSSFAQATVEPVTLITTEPDTSDDIECFGDGFDPLTVLAEGADLTYQWYSVPTQVNTGGTPVPGATSSSFTPPSTNLGISYYYVVVSGYCSSDTSVVSGEYEVTPPQTTIVQHPSTTNHTVCQGAPLPTLTVEVDGEITQIGDFEYQWYSNSTPTNTGGTLITGATNPDFTPPSTTVGTLYYYATGRSDCGTIPTNVSGAFTVTQPTLIENEALNAQEICENQAFSPISIDAIGTGTLEYQWYSNTVAVADTLAAGVIELTGENSDSFTPPTTVGTLYYFVKVSSDCGPNVLSSISGAFTVNPLPTPTFTTSPSTAICVGASVTYTTQSGQSDYAWSGFGIEGTDYTITSGGLGTTNNTVTLTWLTAGTKNISVIYTDPNSCTAITPASNSLTVNALPLPTFATAPVAPVCTGSSVTYTTQSGSGESNYIWSVPGVSGTDYTITSGGIGTSNPTVTLTWLTSGTKNVSVSYTNSNGCAATAPANNSLTVNPLPTPTFTTSPSPLVCVQQGVTYETQSGKSNYVWNIPGTLGVDYSITSGGFGSANPTATIQWLTPGSKNVTVSYTEPTTGCVATTPAISTTTVEPFATVGPTSVAFPSVCINSPTLTPFTQTTSGVTGIDQPGIPGVNGLPPGISASFSGNTITFSGTATTTGLYSYSIPLSGNCINGMTATGTIDVTPVYNITDISSVSATSIGGTATVFFYGDPTSMLNGTYEISYQIKQANGLFTTHSAMATVTNGRGTFSTIPITSNVDTYTVQILTIKKSTDVCTITLPTPPTTYFGVCSAVYSANSTFYVPANVYSITIEVYGAGGGGGNASGAGGGGYSIRKNIPVTPGEAIGIFVGQGGARGGNNGGVSYATRDSNIADQLGNSLVFANGGLGNGSGGTFDNRFSGENGDNSIGSNGGDAGGPLGSQTGGQTRADGKSPGGGGTRAQGQDGDGGNGLIVISYSCPDADQTDCVKIVDDGSKSGTTIIEYTCDDTWIAPAGLAEFTVVVGSGGGGGGSGEGSGGGGSGSIIQQRFSVSSPYGMPAGSNFQIEVGQGGPGATGINANGINGYPSTFSGTLNGSNINISVPGGGGGGSQTTNQGGSGSSGGGGGASPNPAQTYGVGGSVIPITYSGTNVIVYQGNIGGSGDYSAPQNSVAGGGGGGLIPWGSGNDGQNGKAAGNGQGEGGRGGDGRVLNFGDSTRYFGAGGGGIGRYFNGTDKIGEGGSAGGIMIGGSGNLSGTSPVGYPGVDKTGSGGGAGYYGGGKGGDGVVYIYFFNYRILSVEYLHFDAQYNPTSRSGELTWATAKEWENSHFEIERSVDGIKNWTVVGQVPGAGYSEQPMKYAFQDLNLPLAGGNVFYRLRQVDFDGESSYSVTKSIQVPPVAGTTYWRVYPNPTNGEVVNLELLSKEVYHDEPVTLRIISSTGQFELIESEGNEALGILVSERLKTKAAGVYTLEIAWGANREYHKLILRR